MKTSNRIALSFTIISSIFLLLFGILLNIFLGSSQYKNEVRQLDIITSMSTPPPPGKLERRQRIQDRFAQTITLSLTDPDIAEFVEKNSQGKGFRKNIIQFDTGEIFLFKIDDKFVHLRDVTQQVERQVDFFWGTLVSISIFALLSYFLGKGFTRYALKDLESLANYVKGLDVASLDQEGDFSHLPEDDEIKLVSTALHDMQSTIKSDVDRIKRFVSNVSHEFKTPLMMMQSSSELAIASEQYKQGLEKNIHEVKRINSLLDSLIHNSTIQNAPVSDSELVILKPLMQTLAKESSVKHKTNHSISLHIKETDSIIAHKSSLEIVCKNIIENAIKYAPEGEKIDLSLDKKGNNRTIVIANTGSSLPTLDSELIREAFWQADTSKESDDGYGIGLPLAKEIAEKNGRTLSGKNTNEGVAFTLEGTSPDSSAS